MYNNIAKLLNKEILQRDTTEELSHEKPDPLMVAKKYSDEYISLMCALFSYGNAKLIVKFLNSLDFSLLDNSEDIPKKYYYRFQSNQDVAELFKTTRLLKKLTSIEDKFYEGYSNKNSVMDGLVSIISFMYDLNPYRSRSYEFLLGKIPTHKTNSAYKRWHLYLRWMVRYDNLDMGLWTSVKKEHLLAPLDTHTFKIGQKLGLIKRKTYNFKAVLELTESFKKMDLDDPVKFDFALYRIGQEKSNNKR